MPKVSLIKIYNIQSKQNGTCSLDDIIKENIKNNKSLSEIHFSKTNDINLLYDNTLFYDCKYSNDLDEFDYLSDTDKIDILIKNEEKDNIMVDNQPYNVSLKLSDVNVESIIISNHSVLKDFANEKEINSDKSTHYKNIFQLIKYQNTVIKKEAINNK